MLAAARVRRAPRKPPRPPPCSTPTPPRRSLLDEEIAFETRVGRQEVRSERAPEAPVQSDSRAERPAIAPGARLQATSSRAARGGSGDRWKGGSMLRSHRLGKHLAGRRQ